MNHAYPRWQKLLVSAFIVWHWLAVCAWLAPNPSPVKSWLLGRTLILPTLVGSKAMHGAPYFRPQEAVATYLYNTATWQDWAMFAPNPLQENRYVSATISHKDGSIETWAFPRLRDYGTFWSMVYKRTRKYTQNLYDQGNRAFFADFAQWIARQHSTAANPVVKVTVIKNTAVIPAYDRAGKKDWIDYTHLLREQKTQAETLIDYDVAPGDLR